LKASNKLEWGKADAIFGVAAVAFSYLLLFKLPNVPIFFESDQLIFVYEASRLLHGDVMYRDFFQFTLPGTQTYYAAMFSLLGERYWILPATVTIIGAALTLLTLRLSRECIRGTFAFLPPLIFLFFGWRWFGLDGSHRMFSPLFLLLGALILLRSRTLFGFALVGLMCAGASFFTQQRGVIALAAFSAFVLIDGLTGGTRSAIIFRNIAAMVVSFVIAIAAMCSYFVISAGFDTFIYSVLYYPSTYYHYAQANSFAVFTADLGKAASAGGLSGYLLFAVSSFYAVLLPLTVLATLVAFAIHRKTVDWQEWRAPVLLSVLSFSLFVSTAGPGPIRFFQVGAPAIVILVWMVARSKYIRRFETKIVVTAVTILTMIGIGQSVRMQTHWDMGMVETASGKIAFVDPAQLHFYNFIADRTKRGDFVFQAVQPYIYFPFGLRNPTRYPQIWPTDYTRPEQIAEVLNDLKIRRPTFIVWNNNYFVPDELRQSGDHTAPLAEYVKEHYKPVGEVYMLEDHQLQLWQASDWIE
jgi:hypothetical protein